MIVAGLAEASAGALSMGAGEFISARSEAQVQLREVTKELAEMRKSPQHELLEMAQRLSANDATLVAETLSFETLDLAARPRPPRAVHIRKVSRKIWPR